MSDDREALRNTLTKRWTPIAEKLLKVAKRIAPYQALIEQYKDELRAFVDAWGGGFEVPIAGLGTVTVNAGSQAKTKGFTYELDVDAYMKLAPAHRMRLEDDKVVVRKDLKSRDRKPAVKVELEDAKPAAKKAA